MRNLFFFTVALFLSVGGCSFIEIVKVDKDKVNKDKVNSSVSVDARDKEDKDGKRRIEKGGRIREAIRSKGTVSIVEDTEDTFKSAPLSIEPAVIELPDGYLRADKVAMQVKPHLLEFVRRYPESLFYERVLEYVFSFVRNEISQRLLYSKIQGFISPDQEPLIQRAVDKAVEEMIAREAGGSRILFENRLQKSGLSIAELRQRLRRQLLVQRYLRERFWDKIILSREELFNYYLENKEEFSSPERVYVKLIEIDPKRLLSEAADRDKANNSKKDCDKRCDSSSGIDSEKDGNTTGDNSSGDINSNGCKGSDNNSSSRGKTDQDDNEADNTSDGSKENASEGVLLRELAEALADRIIAQLKEGGDFASLAKRYSSSPTAALGGDIGWISPGSYRIKELEEKAFQLKKGSIDKLWVGDKLYIIYVVDRKAAYIVPFSKAQEQIYSKLKERRYNEMVSEYINDLLSQSNIGSIGSFVRSVLANLPSYAQLKKEAGLVK